MEDQQLHLVPGSVTKLQGTRCRETSALRQSIISNQIEALRCAAQCLSVVKCHLKMQSCSRMKLNDLCQEELRSYSCLYTWATNRTVLIQSHWNEFSIISQVIERVKKRRYSTYTQTGQRQAQLIHFQVNFKPLQPLTDIQIHTRI